jgi:hypothetical protein
MSTGPTSIGDSIQESMEDSMEEQIPEIMEEEIKTNPERKRKPTLPEDNKNSADNIFKCESRVTVAAKPQLSVLAALRQKVQGNEKINYHFSCEVENPIKIDKQKIKTNKKPKLEKVKIKPQKKKTKKEERLESKLIAKEQARKRSKVKKPISPPRSAWIMFLMNEKDRQGLPLNQLTQVVGPIWKNMTEEAKEPYKQLYEDDVERYKTELNNLSLADKQLMRKLRKLKRKERSNGCKQPLSSFMFFSQNNRTLVVNQNPGASVPQIQSLMGLKWQSLSPTEKLIYEKLATKAKKEYDIKKSKLLQGKASQENVSEKCQKAKKKPKVDDQEALPIVKG